ncbi:MAG: hypothetical protein ACU0DI_14780 [Paracoccaceae bacterium]
MAITENEIRIAALAELAVSPSGRLTATQLIDRLTDRLMPTGLDAKILDGRSDTYFSQKFRNLVSHRNQGTGFVARGLAVYDSNTESWTILAAGRAEVVELV